MVHITEIGTFVQDSAHPVWLANERGDCIYANAALERLTGLDSNQINEADWRSFLLEEDRAAATVSWQRSLAAGGLFRERVRMRGVRDPAMFELIAFKHKVRDGAELWLFNALPAEDFPPQNPTFETQLRATLDVIPAYTWYAVPSGALTFVNKRCADYLGLPEDHPVRWGTQTAAEWDSHIIFLHPDDHEETRRVWSTCLRTGCAGEVSFRVRNAGGGYRWFLSRAEPLRASDGTLLYWIGVNLEIEERRQAELYLAEAQRLIHTSSWVWNVADGSAAHLSVEWFRIYGFDPAEGAPGWEKRLERVHPEDRLEWKSTIEEAILKKNDYEVDFRIAFPDGKVKWIHTVGHPVLTEAGALVQFFGTSTDITERKQAEQKLKDQEIELRQMLDFAPQLVAVFGAKRERLYANLVALDYLGISLDEWRQRSVGAEVHPDDSEQLRTYADRALSTGSAYELEVRLRKRDGSYRWFLARYNPVRDDMGQITRWYVACTDIQDRKLAEDRLRNENIALREEIEQSSMFEEIVGTSPALKEVLSRISKVAQSDATVLITGETGTGKELVARALHRRSDRGSRAFISVNCAGIPSELIASELFGHERGAFTGATQRRLGRFELAHGGTIFLDEVSELSPETQVALLRVLQEREFERLGGGQPIPVDVRVIAATNRSLRAAVTKGTFREDLFYRLNVFPIQVPPLRERKEDILMLVEYFVQRYASRAGKNIRSIDKNTMDMLQSYDWPGNIRELQNVIERSVILSSADVFSVEELWLSKDSPPQAAPADATGSFEDDQTEERKIIEAALDASRGRVWGPDGAAVKLGMPPSTVDYKIKNLKIRKSKFKFH
jgi:formate hydrogenlyase transcriptional activator